MKLPHINRILVLVALSLTICSRGSAAALSGKVGEVADGGSITVISLNHPVKVRLVGLAAPEAGQPYADAARQHLSDLLLNKYVVVRYSTLARDGYLSGRVLLNDQDIGAQMIRDGVAWYDKSDDSQLGEGERQLYRDSEQAARSERRGLWQDESPVAPWDFHKARLAQINANAPPVPRSKAYVRRGTQASLSNDDLIGGAIGAGSIAGKPDMRPISPDGSPDRWIRYQPADKHFSILAPSDALEVTYPVLDGLGKTMDFHHVIAHNGPTLYMLTWARGPNDNATDASVTSDAIKGLMAGFNRSAPRGLALTVSSGRDLKLSGYTGKQYEISGGPVSGVVRVLTRQIGDEREMFMLCVLNGPQGGGNGDQFLSSFKINQAAIGSK